ncbi:MAG: family 20 glycosylhydrolase [Lentisphaeria bacterium]|jgi:hypothetical protein
MNNKEKFVTSRVIPAPKRIECAAGEMFKLTDGCHITVISPLAAAALSAVLPELCKAYWQIRPAFSFQAGGDGGVEDGYRLQVTAERCEIIASGLDGIRNAFKTLRQLAESERGVLKAGCWLLPPVVVEDEPALAFRGIHLCWFPETPVWEIEKSIRLAAYYKFNYAVIESWGMIRLESHPEYCWDEFAIDKAEVSRLVKLAASLGLTLIPQLNLFGHATSSRCGAGKHMLLNQHPEYAPLFEPDGWTWCIANPAARQYLTELAIELHDLFDKPPFFHIGCDEAYNAGSCSLCRDNYPAKLKAHLLYFHSLFAERGARVMMWHDMLLNRDDPRWNGYIVCGHSENGLGELYKELPKDVVICDWQYGYPEKDGKEPDWPTSHFFKQAGFDVLVCPWLERRGSKSLGSLAKREKLFGMLATTWHWYRASHRMETLFIVSANAVWHPDWAPENNVVYREYLNRHLREIDQDMKSKKYIQFGSVQYQINPTPYQD